MSAADATPAKIVVNSATAGASNGSDATAEKSHDAALLAQANAGDAAAFRQLVERHQRRAHTVAYGLVRNAEDARDVVQEAFLRVYRHLKDFEGNASFATWLYRIVVNLSIDALRRRSPGIAVELTEETDTNAAPDELLPSRGTSDPLEALDRKRLVLAIQSALDRLPPYHRAVILLRELEGFSYEEIAETLEVSKGTVMSRLFHARRKMQVMLREQLGAEVPPIEAENDGENESMT